jgi:hypothetical protein
MQEFILVLSNLIIAMIAFAAPVILFLLSLNSEGIQKAKIQAEIQKRETLNILAKEIAENKDLKAADVEKRQKQLKNNEKKAIKRIQRLTPKIQIKKIFIPLLLSLMLIMFDMVLRNNKFGLYDHYLSMILIALSIAGTATAGIFITELAWEIVTTKQMIEEEKRYPPLEHSLTATGQPDGEQMIAQDEEG